MIRSKPVYVGDYVHHGHLTDSNDLVYQVLEVDQTRWRARVKTVLRSGELFPGLTPWIGIEMLEALTEMEVIAWASQ